MASIDDVQELSQKLSIEKLFIQTERDMILKLNTDVSAAAAQVTSTNV